MEASSARVELSPEEIEDLKKMEAAFEIAAKWGYDPSRPTSYAARAEEFPVGPTARDYTDPLFRVLHLVSRGESPSFERDVRIKFERQSSLTKAARLALSRLLSEYFSYAPMIRAELLAFSISFGAGSLAARGVRFAAAQIVAAADSNWTTASEIGENARIALSLPADL